MTPEIRRLRGRLMFKIGTLCTVLGAGAGAVSVAALGNPPTSSLGMALGFGVAWGSFGVLLGHLEATAEPLHPWFRPKP